VINIKDSVIRGAEVSELDKFAHDRSAYLNASEAGYCIRRQWYSKHMAELEEEQSWGYARRGTHGEKYIIENLKLANVPLLVGDANAQFSIQDEQRKISATPDDVIVYEDYWLPIEIKTIDPRTNRGYLPRPAHITQLKIGMALLNEQKKPQDIKLSRGLIIYMDASNYDDIIQFEVEYDDGILDRMAKRARKVLRPKDEAALDREGKRNGGKECQTMCPFKSACGVSSEDASSRKRANRGSNMDKAAVRYMDIKDSIDTLKVEQDGLKEDIKNELHARKVNKGVVGNIEVSLAIAKGRASLDKKAVKAAGIDLSPFETVGPSSERLTLKRI
jgi:CRISPR/Cas system-associated exonuclease Cas4 (RecB family)